jgi:hypothetical protein
MMERCLFTFSGLVLLGGVGAFLLAVPILSIFASAVLLVGMGLMFGAGVYVGSARVEASIPEAAQSRTVREPARLMVAGSHGD